MSYSLRPVFFAVLLVAACGGGNANPGSPDAGGPLPTLFGGDRPVTLQVPDSYDPATPTPLLIALHGYGGNGALNLAYTRLGNLVSGAGILLLGPDGNMDTNGSRFWNATRACCDFGTTGVDDVAYIVGLVDEVSQFYNVDPRRVVLFGHSNGGFMAYRLACDRPDVFAGLVSLAGAAYPDPAACSPTEAVSVLQIHGTADTTIAYGGGSTCSNCDFPGAVTTVATWANYNGCAGTVTEDATLLDIDNGAAGAETTVTRHDGCPAGVDAELWTMAGAPHTPSLVSNFDQLIYDWLSAHPKP